MASGEAPSSIDAIIADLLNFQVIQQELNAMEDALDQIEKDIADEQTSTDSEAPGSGRRRSTNTQPTLQPWIEMGTASAPQHGAEITLESLSALGAGSAPSAPSSQLPADAPEINKAAQVPTTTTESVPPTPNTQELSDTPDVREARRSVLTAMRAKFRELEALLPRATPLTSPLSADSIHPTPNIEALLSTQRLGAESHGVPSPVLTPAAESIRATPNRDLPANTPATSPDVFPRASPNETPKKQDDGDSNKDQDIQETTLETDRSKWPLLYRIMAIDPDIPEELFKDKLDNHYKALAATYQSGDDFASNDRWTAYSHAYKVLADPEKKRSYDEHKTVPEELEGFDFANFDFED